MSLEQKLNITSQQKITITTNFITSIEILAMNTVELKATILKEINENPILKETTTNTTIEQYKKYNYNIIKNNYKKLIISNIFNLNNKTLQKNHINNQQLNNFSNATTYNNPSSLINCLAQQIRISKFNILEKEIALRLIEHINSKGYLEDPKITFSSIANKLLVPITWIEIVRKKISQLEPLGCCSINIKEYLLTKLNLINSKNYKLIIIILNKYFKLLINKKLKTLTNKLNVSKKDIMQSISILSRLGLSPEEHFIENKFNYNNYIIPDIYLEYNEKNYKILLNNSLLPKFCIDYKYASYLKQNHSQAIKKYVEKKIRNAFFLVKCILNRQDTICKVALSLVNNQKQWLENNASLKPLTQKAIAKEVGIHESTVSRVIKDKYIQTPRGIIELKSFFASTLNNKYEKKISNSKTKDIISALIKKENKTKPLSDNILAKKLEKLNIILSRRTVNKYRNQLKIYKHTMRRKIL